jgi:hypothetical protein
MRLLFNFGLFCYWGLKESRVDPLCKELQSAYLKVRLRPVSRMYRLGACWNFMNKISIITLTKQHTKPSSNAAPQGDGAPDSVLLSDHERIEKLRLWECLEVGEFFDWKAVYEDLSCSSGCPSGPVKGDPNHKS